jgi:cell division protease FtsH
VRQLATAALDQAVALLRPRRKLMDELVNLLIEKETIEGQEFQAVVERHGGSLNGLSPLPEVFVAQPASQP